MHQYKLKIPPGVDKVIDDYEKIRDGVVGAYEKIESVVTETYQRIEDKFVDTFLEKVDNNTSNVNNQADLSTKE